MQRRDWRQARVQEVDARLDEVRTELLPLLRTTETPPTAEVRAWTERLVSECREGLHRVLPLHPGEVRFLEGLNERGEILPDLLTDDHDLRERIRTSPALRWKAQNVRQWSGLEPGPGSA